VTGMLVSHSALSLLSGIEFVAVAIGLFGIGEVLVNVEKHWRR